MLARILRRGAALALVLAAVACEISTGPGGSPSPDSFSLLIERRNPAGQRSYYMMSADGKRVTPFPFAPVDARALMPSPDGQTIAYLRDVGNGFVELWAMDRDGANKHALLSGSYVIQNAAWSPNGKKLVLEYSNDAASNDIAIINPDGTGFVDLTPDPLPGVIFDHDPSWSPDGTRIAYSSNASGTRRLWIMNADGSNQHQVLPSAFPSSERQPVWAPDTSNYLAIVATTSAGAGIAFVRADGTDFKHVPIAAGPNDPVWLPDGRLVYVANPTGDYDLWTVDRVSGATAQLTTRRDNDVHATVIRNVAPWAWQGFRSPVSYSINRPTAVDMIAADVLTDGRPDIAVLSPVLNEIRLMRGGAAGNFQSVGSLFAESDVSALRTGMISTDNAPDIIGKGDSAAYLWRGRVDGPGIATRIAMNGMLRGVAVADLDGNGRADIVSLVETTVGQPFRLLTHTIGTTDNVVFAVNMLTSRSNGKNLCVGDVNGDGRPDVVVVGGTTSLNAYVGEGRGELGVNDLSAAGTALSSNLDAIPYCGDFNNDGFDDLALFSSGAAQSVTVHRINAGTFGSAVRISAAASAVAFADIDNDGDLDVILASSSSPAILVAKNRGSGTFDNPVSYAVPNIPVCIMTGDFNGDNWTDVALIDATGTLVVLQNAGRPS